MRLCLCHLLTLALLLGCRSPSSPLTTPTATVDPASQLLRKASQAHKASDHEGEALALREAVDLLAREGSTPQLEQASAACVQAMVEAGDNVASYRLWKGLEAKNGASVESKRMKERARKLMLQQAQELEAQAMVDLNGGRPQAALCTAQAALHLYEEGGAEKRQIEQARAGVDSLKRGKKPEEE